VTVVFDSQADKEVADKPDFVVKFERAVVLAASLVDYFIREGAEVRLMTYGDDSGFGIGRIHSYTMLRQLAQLTPETNEDDLDHQLRTIFTPSPGAEEQFRVLITHSARRQIVTQSSHSTHVISFEEL
jgi:uncharacterized protein (DUF58 family)